MNRRKTISVKVGDIFIGSDFPVRVQTMTNTDTNDIDGSVEQVKRCVAAGAELVRFTTQGEKEVDNLAVIKQKLREQGINIPLVADVHFNANVAIKAAQVVEKVRINPGNFFKNQEPRAKSQEEQEARHFDQREKSRLQSRFPANAQLEKPKENDNYELQTINYQLFTDFLNVCKKHNTAVRIGVNHGSLSERILNRYGDTPEGMVESCMELLRICREENFDQIVISLKASNTILMINAVRLLVEKMNAENFYFPLHLGVTEAGDGEDGRIKSAIGIGALLIDGIGDTIRVSLAEAPENEIPTAFNILQAARARITKTEYIACPSCGRTLFDLQTTLQKVKAATSHLVGLKIAVMGCIVNGVGEMADADFGYVGAGKGRVSLYKGKTCVERNIPEEQAVEKLLEVIGDLVKVNS